jgi:ligand-binding SRPBCC domain-containing protein
MPVERVVDRVVWRRGTGSRPVGAVQLHSEVMLPAPLQQTFDFFADAANLERLTPPWLRFRILTPMPVTMREGLEIDYRIMLYGLPIPWRSRIDVWEPRRRFVDRQVLGPYQWWRHEHLFTAHRDGTAVVDRVEYVPRLRWLSLPVVRRDVERIFAYRRATLLRHFS